MMMKYMLSAINLLLAVIMLSYGIYALWTKKDQECGGIDVLVGSLYFINSLYILAA